MNLFQKLIPGWQEKHDAEVRQRNWVAQLIPPAIMFGGVGPLGRRILPKNLFSEMLIGNAPITGKGTIPNLTIPELAAQAQFPVDAIHTFFGTPRNKGRGNAEFIPAVFRKLHIKAGIPIPGNHPQGSIGIFPPTLSRGVPADMLAHELGHARTYGGLEGVLPKIISRARLPGGIAMGTSLLSSFPAFFGDKPLADREKWLNAASLTAAGGSLPVLADEFNASRTGLKLLRQTGKVSPEVMKLAFRRLLRAGGTYGLMSAGLIGTPQLVKQYYRHKQKK